MAKYTSPAFFFVQMSGHPQGSEELFLKSVYVLYMIIFAHTMNNAVSDYVLSAISQ